MTTSTPSRHRGWSIALGVLLILGGILAIAEPVFASIAASLFFGWLVLFSGIAHLIYAWSERTTGAVIFEVLIGIVYLAAAVYLIWKPLAGTAVLTFVLAVYIGIEGILELVVFAKVRRRPFSFWFLVDGLVSLLLSALIFFHWPSSSFWALGMLLGVSLLFSGVARLTHSARSRRLGVLSAV